MKLYYINRDPYPDDNHELHLANCNQLPNIFNRACLGDYETSKEALWEAKKRYPKTTLCPNCLKTQNKPIPFYKKWFQKK